MRSIVVAVLTLILAMVLAAPAAVAKGPASAQITGVDGAPIDISGGPGSGEPGSRALLGRLAEDAGLWVVGFGEDPHRLTAEPPDGDLGPKLTLSWVVPGPTGDDTVVQDLYPYADAGAVTFTRANQPYLGGATEGGWYVAGPALAATLVEAGVPAEPPTSGPAMGMLLTAGMVTGTAAFAGILTVARRRRAPDPAVPPPRTRDR